MSEKNYPEKDRFDLIRKALDEGLIKVAKYLLTENHNKDGLCSLKELFHLVTKTNHLEEVKFFVENYESSEKSRCKILCTAAEEGYLQIVKYLIGENFPLRYESDSVFEAAARYGNLEIIKFLIEKYPDDQVSRQDILDTAASEDHPEIVEYLKEKMSGRW